MELDLVILDATTLPLLFQRDASSHERDGESKCRIGD